jgi:hypothetical protein
MIFQNGFGSYKEVTSPREPEPKSFFEKPEPCQRDPNFLSGLVQSLILKSLPMQKCMEITRRYAVRMRKAVASKIGWDSCFPLLV